jgi:hypothetical protein
MKDETADLLAIEEQRCQAERDGDMTTLERLLDDSLVYIHTTGLVDSKKSLIASRDKMKFLKMARRDLKVQVSGDLAVITGGLSVEVRVTGVADLVAMDMLVTQVLVRRGGQWRFVHQQCTTPKK